jgi:predicted nucleic acid-binding protein
MSEISKKWFIENKYFDKEGIEENLIYSGLTANEFIEILDSYHNSMSDVSDEEIEKWFQNYLREGITGANQRIAINEFVKWLRSSLPNKVDVEELIQAIKTQTQIIEALVGSQRVVNLDESISYYKKLVEKHTI